MGSKPQTMDSIRVAEGGYKELIEGGLTNVRVFHGVQAGN